MPFRERNRVSTLVSSWLPTRQWLPSDISGMVLWLDAGTLTGADASAVAVWVDDAPGNQNTAQQIFADNRPVVKTGIVNGRNVVRFATNDYFPIGTTIPAPVHIFAVLRPTAGAAIYSVLCSTVINGALQYCIVANKKQQFVKSSIAVIGESTTALSTDNFSCVAASYESPNAVFRLNGADDGSASSAQTVSDITHIGINFNTEFLNGDIAELIVYGAVLSAANRNMVEAYLMGKYGIA